MSSTEEKLKTLKNQRSGNRGFVNGVIQKIQNVVMLDVTEKNKIHALALKETLRQKSETLNNIHMEWLSLLTDEAEITEEIKNVSEFEMNIQEHLFLLDSWILRRLRKIRARGMMALLLIVVRK